MALIYRKSFDYILAAAAAFQKGLHVKAGRLFQRAMEEPDADDALEELNSEQEENFESTKETASTRKAVKASKFSSALRRRQLAQDQDMDLKGQQDADDDLDLGQQDADDDMGQDVIEEDSDDDLDLSQDADDDMGQDTQQVQASARRRLQRQQANMRRLASK
jgi:hypothetical protein